MISHKYKAIFVHIPKSAGTSIGTKLGIYPEESFWGMQDHRSIQQLTPIQDLFLLKAGRLTPKIIHRRIRDIYLNKRDYPTKNQLDEYFKFTFVRNSWARTFSWYSNIIYDERHCSYFNIDKSATFKWFVENKLDTLKNQLYYITDARNNVAVDYIGKFETLNQDFAYICDVLGISNSILPERNRIGTPHYVSHYNDNTIELVRQYFIKDIEYFGFEFGK